MDFKRDKIICSTCNETINENNPHLQIEMTKWVNATHIVDSHSEFICQTCCNLDVLLNPDVIKKLRKLT